MRISDWSSDWCSSDLSRPMRGLTVSDVELESILTCPECGHRATETMPVTACQFFYECTGCGVVLRPNQGDCCVFCSFGTVPCPRSEEHTSELQSLMRISYAVFCLKKKQTKRTQ